MTERATPDYGLPVEVGSRWQRNPPGREVVEVQRVWDYSHELLDVALAALAAFAHVNPAVDLLNALTDHADTRLARLQSALGCSGGYPCEAHPRRDCRLIRQGDPK